MNVDPEKLLGDVPNNNNFRLSNGNDAHNLESLYATIMNSDDSVFYNHVTNDRNDFANWIRHCVGDEELYGKIVDMHQKEVFLGVLAEEIAYLKSELSKKKALLDFMRPPAPIAPRQSNVDLVLLNQSTSTESSPAQETSINLSDSTNPGNQGILADESYEFEQVLKSIIEEIDGEIMSWDVV